MTDLLSESRKLSELLLLSSALARDTFAEISAGLGIPVSIARALCTLERPEPMSELAMKLRCDKSYITPLTDQMEELGFANRVPGVDRRTKMIELTMKGQKTRDKLEAQIAKISPMMNKLTVAERKTLRNLLEKVATG